MSEHTERLLIEVDVTFDLTGKSPHMLYSCLDDLYAELKKRIPISCSRIVEVSAVKGPHIYRRDSE